MSKIVSKPKVYLLGAQEVRQSGMAKFLADHNINWQSDTDIPAQILTESAGRICYMSFECPRPGGNKTYIEHIKESKHGSVFEHGVWNFLFTDVSRSLTHELIRHRAGMGYSQLSQRFVDSKDVSFVVPDLIEQDPLLYEEWLQCVVRARDFYAKCSKELQQKLKDKGLKGTDARKQANQAARSVLPNATETKIFVTANARAIRHFLEQRGSAGADREIRQLANVLLETMLVEAPALFCDYKTKALEDGTFEITTDYPKV